LDQFGAGICGTRVRDQHRRTTLRDIIDLALELDADALTVGGDLYEHDRVTSDTGSFIASQFARLAPRPVLVSPGNHDPYLPSSLYHRLAWPTNVHIFDSTTWLPFALSSDLAVWGVGHTKHGLQTNLLRTLRLSGPRTDLALFHGWDLEAGPERRLTYCPFTMSDVKRSGAAFVLLGHYHQMRLWPTKSPQYGYPGSLQSPALDAHSTRHVLLLDANHGSISVEALQLD
jgi:DNA repair exonuclease SbcCD nuclease subunit